MTYRMGPKTMATGSAKNTRVEEGDKSRIRSAAEGERQREKQERDRERSRRGSGEKKEKWRKEHTYIEK